MDFKMPKSQEQSEQLQNKELESIAGGRLNDLVKNLLLRGKVAKWAALAASVVGISVTAMPAGATHRVDLNGSFGFDSCFTRGDFFEISQRDAQGRSVRTMCFADAGELPVVIADVTRFTSGNNAGYILTNKGRVDFGKWQGFNFIDNNWGTVTVLRIVIY